ncbi:hypothetical protein KPL71_002523 [Citrus sinensis]|uniref:Uncharacterized protein n=1 Tax=Citrus sinensis TaxID=2711 RepID=A0ACB8P7R6_CITSI|nr:hypothetical protein KPL71_002523 [Citrus sinensis]
MGCCVSLRSSSSSAAAATNIKNVRVVHLNGCVEEFDYPVSVSQVTGRPPKHFIFTASQLLSAGLQPLKPDTLLERGNVYFLLPSTSFDYADVSPLTLAATVKKLTEKAKSGNSVAMPSPPRNSPARSPSRTVNDVEKYLFGLWTDKVGIDQYWNEPNDGDDKYVFVYINPEPEIGNGSKKALVTRLGTVVPRDINQVVVQMLSHALVLERLLEGDKSMLVGAFYPQYTGPGLEANRFVRNPPRPDHRLCGRM